MEKQRKQDVKDTRLLAHSVLPTHNINAYVLICDKRPSRMDRIPGTNLGLTSSGLRMEEAPTPIWAPGFACLVRDTGNIISF
ncbi:hypothetical protein STEG23_028717 [Scotinomys teguina]